MDNGRRTLAERERQGNDDKNPDKIFCFDGKGQREHEQLVLAKDGAKGDVDAIEAGGRSAQQDARPKS